MGLAADLADAANVQLVAQDVARSIRRGYRIERSVDLFGHHIVDWSWGRIGTAGQSRRVSFAGGDEARRFVRDLLVRRDSAPKRIGTSYRFKTLQMSLPNPPSRQLDPRASLQVEAGTAGTPGTPGTPRTRRESYILLGVKTLDIRGRAQWGAS